MGKNISRCFEETSGDNRSVLKFDNGLLFGLGRGNGRLDCTNGARRHEREGSSVNDVYKDLLSARNTRVTN